MPLTGLFYKATGPTADGLVRIQCQSYGAGYSSGNRAIATLQVISLSLATQKNPCVLHINKLSLFMHPTCLFYSAAGLTAENIHVFGVGSMIPDSFPYCNNVPPTGTQRKPNRPTGCSQYPRQDAMALGGLWTSRKSTGVFPSSHKKGFGGHQTDPETTQASLDRTQRH